LCSDSCDDDDDAQPMKAGGGEHLLRRAIASDSGHKDANEQHCRPSHLTTKLLVQLSSTGRRRPRRSKLAAAA
jgi:hypothetical protein